MPALIKKGIKKFLQGGGTGEGVTWMGGFQTRLGLGKLTVFDKDGNPVVEANDLNVKKGQRVLLEPAEGALVPSKYEILVGINKELVKAGDVSYSAIVAPRSGELVLAFTARQAIDLSELGHIWELYMVD